MQETHNAARVNSIETIEKTLYDITTLFKRFATIVQEHQVLVERIDANTENALQDLEGAKTELRETYDNTKSTRKLMMKIFFILMIFSTLYILFVL
jgi:syntaxin 5